MVKKIALAFIFVLSCPQIFSQNTYYVAPSASGGNNGNAGSLAAPFETLTHAIDQLSAGDILYIREGTYRETLTIDQDGSSGNLITIQNYNNELVTIDGTTDISGSWSAYNGVSGAFKLSYTGDITQLFVDDEPMVNARWPNAQFYDDSIFSHSTWAEGDEGDDSNPNSVAGSLQIDEDVHDPGSLNLQNSIGILNIGSFKTETVQITGHTQNGSSDDIITYTHNTSSNNDGVYKTTYKDKHHYYFFEGKLDFLDTNNEWFHDKPNNVLYLFPDNGSDPSSRSIKAKNNDYAITLSGANYIKIKGINFFATTINLTNNSDDNIIEECNFYFPSASKRMLGLTNGLGATNVTSISNNSDDNTIKKCLFENAEGEALVIQGDRNKVENNYFHHIDWSATDLNGLMVTIYCTGDSTTFTKNTIHTTGASATVLPGKASVFSYNRVTNTGLLQSDGAVFQGTKNYVEGSKVHHNFVYDTKKYAFRYDAPGGDAAVAGSYGIMHHNIADNTNGLMIKGNNQIIAHNTVINTINNRNDIIILGEDCSNTSTWLYNNLAKRIGSHRSSQLFSLPDDSPMPMATIGYIEDDNGTSANSNDDFWRECVNNDVSNNWIASVGDGNSQSNIDQINVSRTGISYYSNIQTLINYDSSDGKSELDYVPNNNVVIVDQGVSPTNSVETNSVGGSNTLNNLVPHTNNGSAPDIGALEHGVTAWSAGIDWTPKFKRAVWKTDASSTDWHSAKNWSTENVPNADVNVLIPTGATNYPVVTGSNATCNNLIIYPSANLTLNASYSLTINGDFRIMGTANVKGDIVVQ